MVRSFYKCHVHCRQLGFIMSLLFILSGCNITGGASSSSTPAQPPVRTNPLKAVYAGPLICNPPAPGQFFAEKSLVLATDRLTYDQAEVNQISAFIDSQGTDLFPDGNIVPSTPPDTLSYITGSAPASVTGEESSWSGSGSPCHRYLTLTNISQQTLQIPQINLRYLRSAGPNTQLYRLIDVCSIGKRIQRTIENSCPIIGAGPGAGYDVNFTIGLQPTNTVYSAKPSRSTVAIWDGLSEIPILRPGDAAQITIWIGVPNYDSGLFVSAVPEVTVTSANNTQTIALTQLTTDIAIAAPQNVSCYALKDNTFVEQNPQIQDGSWCV